MKILLFILFCVLLFSCKKDNEINKNPYLGKWELAKTTSNGFVGIFYYSPGNGNTVSFDNNSKFTQTIVSPDTSYSNTYNYTLERGNRVGCGTEEPSVILLKLSNGQIQVAVIQDTLLLLQSRECTDINVATFYRKIR